MRRINGRAWNELRPTRILPGYLSFAEGSALIELGLTRVLCAVSVEDRVPPFRRGSGQGWVTAEYSMLPRSTQVRTPRESTQGRVGGRTQEIQRLIGRSLRAVTDLTVLGERTFQVDCDVLQADGGTRTAAITGSYVALYQAIRSVYGSSPPAGQGPLRSAVAATSVGILNGLPLLDLCYEEDSQAEVDFNVVMTSKGEFVEIQGTAEGRPFSRAVVDQLLELAQAGIQQLFQVQQEAIAQLS
ncbi:MAG: ribonuclease PH [Chloroflexi bacterium]|nr:ribonuclease PH [Chloroflexota bacterium]